MSPCLFDIIMDGVKREMEIRAMGKRIIAFNRQARQWEMLSL